METTIFFERLDSCRTYGDATYGGSSADPAAHRKGFRRSSSPQYADGRSKKKRIRDDTSTSGYGVEIDTLIRVHKKEIRSRVEEINKGRCEEIISTISKKLKEKDTELETAERKHADLEAKMKAISAQSRIWLEHAANAEAAARGIAASLDRVLRRGSGDAQSRCFEGGDGTRRSCRACRRRDVAVLLLPCRHLCLCEQCEPVADTCPVCNAEKSGGLLVLI